LRSRLPEIPTGGSEKREKAFIFNRLDFAVFPVALLLTARRTGFGLQNRFYHFCGNISTHGKGMSTRRRSSTSPGIVLKELRAFGLTYPGVERKSPWPGHDDLAVRGKTFAYLSAEGKPISLSFKLPYTGEEALRLPFAKPTPYGLGRSGWVNLQPSTDEMPSLGQLKLWLDESYRAQAPKKLAAQAAGKVEPAARTRREPKAT
jgi:hypothetical protein